MPAPKIKSRFHSFIYLADILIVRLGSCEKYLTRFHLHFYNFPWKVTSSFLPSVVAPLITLTLFYPIHHVGHWTNATQVCLINLHLSKEMM